MKKETWVIGILLLASFILMFASGNFSDKITGQVTSCTNFGDVGDDAYTQGWIETAVAMSMDDCQDADTVLEAYCTGSGDYDYEHKTIDCNPGDYCAEGYCQTPVPTCGDGVVEGSEQCDDGNTITESCTYSQPSCTVCDASCQNVAGTTSYCSDGICDDVNEDATSCSEDCAEGNGGGSEGWLYDGYCWYNGELSQSCDDVCFSNGGVASLPWPSYDNCAVSKHWYPSCNCENSPNYNLLYKPIYKKCYYDADTYSADSKWSTFIRQCACQEGCGEESTSECGDGVIEDPEYCDSGASNTNTACTPQYEGSCIYCDTSCISHTINGGICGDDTCDDGYETYSTCSEDCLESCGDSICNNNETCSTCPGDCGECAPECGDGECNGDETCSTCVADCGCPNGYECSEGSCQAIVALSNTNGNGASNQNQQDNNQQTSVTWTKTENAPETQFESESGYTTQISEEERVKVKIAGSDHYVGIIDITDTTATIEIASTPQLATLRTGNERKFDVNDDGEYYDLYVKLNSITDGKVDITIKAISEQITTESESDQESQESDAQEKKQYENTIWIFILVGIIVAIIIVVVLIYLFYRRTKQNQGIVQQSSFSQP